jgi:Zn finger protein HypA/HybF involved in hydrogenase expression
MIQPKPYKLKCPNCNYSKTVCPKSDVLNPMDMLSVCPKCKVQIKREELSGISKLFADIFK